MATKLLELRPDRNLLNPDFTGYKLSLEKIPLYQECLQKPIDRVLPNSDQYSLLHAKLFGLHNYLFNDHFNKGSTVYFIDGEWNVQKVVIDTQTNRLSEIRKIWQIPPNEERNSGCYNLSLYFVSKDMAIISDGCGILHIFETGDRNENENWRLVFSDEVLDSNKCFMIIDAVCIISESKCKELHCLLNKVERNSDIDGKFCTVINWVTLTQTLEDGNWGLVSLKVLKGSGQIYYCALERNCKFIYVASDTQFKFILDSENPIVEKESESQTEELKVYTWLQTSDDITLRFNANSHVNKNNVHISTKPFYITIRHHDTILLEGELKNRIDADLTYWTVTNNILEIVVTKTESGLMWPEFVKGDKTGEQILDPGVVAEVHQRLAHLCSETEVLPEESGPTFSSQQLEECDLANDDTALFERICGNTHAVTHRINLGSLQMITSAKLDANSAPALVLRHDVDACLWQPTIKQDDWKIKHEGTLLAFGYVQASKQQRKFSTCSSSLSYSVVCESSRHAFIYRQNKELVSSELRNRRSGRRIGLIAEQQVVTLGDDEILGIHAAEDLLYLLTEKKLIILAIKC